MCELIESLHTSSPKKLLIPMSIQKRSSRSEIDARGVERRSANAAARLLLRSRAERKEASFSSECKQILPVISNTEHVEHHLS
jgi:hypothetical protein